MIPAPRDFALMDLHARGQALAGLSIAELDTYAHEYARFLNTLLDGTNVQTEPREIFVHMLVAVRHWYERQRAVECGDVAREGLM